MVNLPADSSIVKTHDGTTSSTILPLNLFFSADLLATYSPHAERVRYSWGKTNAGLRKTQRLLHFLEKQLSLSRKKNLIPAPRQNIPRGDWTTQKDKGAKTEPQWDVSGACRGIHWHQTTKEGSVVRSRIGIGWKAPQQHDRLSGGASRQNWIKERDG